jgi:histidinol phosphatase-like PHP family hydrolase
MSSWVARRNLNLKSANQVLARREFLILAAALTSSLPAADDIPVRDGIPQVDYHVHIGDELTIDQAVSISQRHGMKFGLLQHAGEPGHGFAVSDDASLDAWLQSLAGKPVFKGIEAETVNWASRFSKQAIARLDYVQADALGMPDASGAPFRIWQPDFRPSDPQAFMDRYVDFHVQRISTEPIDVFAVPTFLPASLISDYDRLWTERRMRAIIDRAIKHNVALEIDCRFRIPRFRFLEMAKSDGVRFSLGSNFQTAERVGDISYCVAMYKRLKLKPGDLFRPSGAGKRLSATARIPAR